MSKSFTLRVSVPSPRSYGTILLLHPSSLKRLGILYLTTCVGFGEFLI